MVSRHLPHTGDRRFQILDIPCSTRYLEQRARVMCRIAANHKFAESADDYNKSCRVSFQMPSAVTIQSRYHPCVIPLHSLGYGP